MFKYQFIKDIPNHLLKTLIEQSIKKDVQPEHVSDEAIQHYKDDYGEQAWTTGMKSIGLEISPKRKKVRGEGEITGTYLFSLDRTKKDNTIDHFVIADDELIRIKDRGVTEMDFGSIYKFDCITWSDQKTEEVSYGVKKEISPVKVQQLDFSDVIAELHKVKKPVHEIKDNEVAVAELQMTYDINPFKNKETNEEKDMWVSDKKDGTGYNFRIGAFQPAEDEDDNDIRVMLMFFPQRYGEQLFANIFPDNFERNFVQKNRSDLTDILLNWIVPTPTNLKVFVIGRWKVEWKEKYKEMNLAVIPCGGLVMDPDQMPDSFMEAIEKGEVNVEDYQQPDEPPEEPQHDEDDTEPEPDEDVSDATPEDPSDDGQTDGKAAATIEFVVTAFQWNPGVDLEGMNDILASKGLYTTAGDFKKAQKEAGLEPEEEKPLPPCEKDCLGCGDPMDYDGVVDGKHTWTCSDCDKTRTMKVK